MSRSVAVSRRIAAAPEAIFAVLVDPTKHPLIDGSGTVVGVAGRVPSRLGLGSRFSMDMRLVVPYRMPNRVVEHHEGRRIAWTNLGRVVWRFDLVPDGSLDGDDTDPATVVTETFEWARSPFRHLYERLGCPERNRASMEASLERLARLVEGPAGAGGQAPRGER